MTPAQRRALEALQAKRLIEECLIDHGPWLDSFRCRVVLTDAGWEVLNG